MSVLTTCLVFGILAYPWVRLARADIVKALVVVVGFVAFSSHVFAILYRLGVPADVVRGLIPVKDLLAFSALAVLLWSVRRTVDRRWLLAGGLVVLIVLGYGIAGIIDDSSDVLAISTRGLVVALAGVSSGLMLDAEQRGRLLRWASLVFTVAAVYSLLELVLPIEFIVNGLEVGEYWADVKQQESFTLVISGIGRIPGNFLVDPYADVSMRRLSGSFGDPLTAGTALAFGLIASLAATAGRRRLIQAGVILLALVLTFTRAGWVLAGAALIPWVWVWFRQLDARRRAASAGAVVVAVAAFVIAVAPVRDYLVEVFSGRHGSTLGHIEAVERMQDYSYSLPGSGIGSIGAIQGNATESVFATVLVQLGLIAGGIFLAATLYLLIAARDRWTPRASFWFLLAGLMVTWAVSEQWLAFNAGWLIGLFVTTGATLPSPTRSRRDDPAVDLQLARNDDAG